MATILGDRIKYLREKRGWSQEQLVIQARHVSGDEEVLSRVTLSRIENGHQMPTIVTLKAIAAVHAEALYRSPLDRLPKI